MTCWRVVLVICLFSFCGLELTRHRISRNVLYDYIAMHPLPTSGFPLDFVKAVYPLRRPVLAKFKYLGAHVCLRS